MPTVTANNVSGCAGTSISLSGTPAGGIWSVANPYIGSSTTYTHTYTDGNGCTNTSTNANITVNPLPTASIIANGPLNFCTGGSVLLTANIGTGFGYQWKKGGTIIFGATSSAYTATATGTFKVIVTNQNGCTKTSNALSATGPPAVSITTTGLPDLCPGDSVKFEVAFVSSNIYQWRKGVNNISGATSNSYYAKTAGNYKVNVTNSFGCSKLSGKKTVTTNCRFEVAALESSEKIKIYPNPFVDNFNLSLNKNNSYEIMIYDLSGKKIENHIVVNAENFALGENLEAGFYLCEIIYENKRELLKIVKAAQ
ncbi:MAG: T9SS type A sorting domain-containing protein [Bacteroidia bacterium]